MHRLLSYIRKHVMPGSLTVGNAVSDHLVKEATTKPLCWGDQFPSL